MERGDSLSCPCRNPSLSFCTRSGMLYSLAGTVPISTCASGDSPALGALHRSLALVSDFFMTVKWLRAAMFPDIRIQNHQHLPGLQISSEQPPSISPAPLPAPAPLPLLPPVVGWGPCLGALISIPLFQCRPGRTGS